MPKRKHVEKREYYQNKLRRLEEKSERRRRRIIDSSDSEHNSDNETNMDQDNGNPEDQQLETVDPPESLPEPVLEPVPELDPEILSALGESTEEAPKFGEKIHDNLARLWMPILCKGLNKDVKEKIMKDFAIPENCTFLQAPKLNPEISAAVNDLTRGRDKRVESVQQQLGLGLTALNRGLSLLIDSDSNKVKAIKFLSDSCRLLCDLHHVETQARIKFVTPGLDKSFLNVIQDVNRDDMLFGNKLSERIKDSKVIEKQGLQIKKIVPNPKPSTSTSQTQPATSRLRSQVNWTGPPRQVISNRGGRGGPRKHTAAGTAGRRAPPAAQGKPSLQNRQQRAPQQQ